MAEEKSEYQRLVELEAKIKSSNLIQDRSYMLKKYEKCLIGSELVAWLLETREAITKYEAISLGIKLLENGLMHHVMDEHTFKDDKLFYRFYSDDGANPVTRNSALFIAEGASMKGTLLKKGNIKYAERYFILKANEQKLYYFNSPTSSEIKGTIDLSGGKVDVSECGECKPGNFCFVVFGTDGKTYTLCSPRSKEQEAWIQALVSCGCNFLEDQVVSDVKETSLFEFKCLDITKNEISLDMYRGRVCLVVNVASY